MSHKSRAHLSSVICLSCPDCYIHPQTCCLHYSGKRTDGKTPDGRKKPSAFENFRSSVQMFFSGTEEGSTDLRLVTSVEPFTTSRGELDVTKVRDQTNNTLLLAMLVPG